MTASDLRVVHLRPAVGRQSQARAIALRLRRLVIHVGLPSLGAPSSGGGHSALPITESARHQPGPRPQSDSGPACVVAKKGGAVKSGGEAAAAQRLRALAQPARGRQGS